jgi:hypothetical protein
MMNSIKKQAVTEHARPARSRLKNHQMTNFNYSVKRRGSYIYTPYRCRVVMVEGFPYLRAEAGRTWFVPVQEGDGYTYKKVTVARNEAKVIELERMYHTSRHREWVQKSNYKYVKRTN